MKDVVNNSVDAVNCAVHGYIQTLPTGFAAREIKGQGVIMGIVGGAVRNVGKAVNRAAAATTATAGAVGGAAVNGIVGGVTGALVWSGLRLQPASRGFWPHSITSISTHCAPHPL